MQILTKKFKEALFGVIPVTLIITVINFLVSPMSGYELAGFFIGALFLTVGISFYSLGCETAMESIGGYIGSSVTKSRKLLPILIIAFLIGLAVTMAEPDLSVLATQVTVPKIALLLTISAGVGIFLVLAVLRAVFNLSLKWILIISYGIVFILASLIDYAFVPLAFDSGGVTTGPITVPFILAFGISLSSVLGKGGSEDSGFGTIAICSVGPIIAVLLLSLVFKPEASNLASATDTEGFLGVLNGFSANFYVHLREVGIALLPIALIFIVFQIVSLKLPARAFAGRLVGIFYTYFGLVIFLTGVTAGFLPTGIYMGKALAGVNKFVIIPVGVIIGAAIILAEPAVQVLCKQVEEITNGTITGKNMLIVLTIGMAVAVGFAMLRVATGIKIWWILIPGYFIAIVLSFFVPKVFTAIAFDSGGVASGPLTASFLLPFACGACAVIGNNPVTDAFGTVAFVAMSPLVALQISGLIYKLKLAKKQKVAEKRYALMLKEEGSVIEFTLKGVKDAKY